MMPVVNEIQGPGVFAHLEYHDRLEQTHGGKGLGTSTMQQHTYTFIYDIFVYV